jgi:hypothetical protein
MVGSKQSINSLTVNKKSFKTIQPNISIKHKIHLIHPLLYLNE